MSSAATVGCTEIEHRAVHPYAAPSYRLRCLDTDVVFDEPHAGHPHLVSPFASRPALVRAEYPARRLRLAGGCAGLYRFRHWLPVRRLLADAPGPVTFRADTFARHLGMTNLFVTFTGWAPERGAYVPTGTFKELESYAVYGRLAAQAERTTLVVASAGNTARAFLRVASAHNLPLVVVVPEGNLERMWLPGARSDSTVVVAAGDGADYSDAIALAEALCGDSGFAPEGGARNVARRDGMGTTFLSAATTIGRIPDHYVQAVGSGTGAIAAWEANLRLIADGGFGRLLARHHLAQNAPFQILVDSWAARSRTLVTPGEERMRRDVTAIGAPVLANRTPPWSPIGGLFDALSATDGTMYALDNDAATEAGRLFARHEAIVPAPAASVAVAALIEAVERGEIGRHDVVALNLTGGGFDTARRDLGSQPIVPDLVADRTMYDTHTIAEAVRSIQAARRRDASGTARSRRSA